MCSFAIDAWDKTALMTNSDSDVWFKVNAPMFVVRTKNHFIRYDNRKTVMIPKGIEFSIYNVTDTAIAVEISFDLINNISTRVESSTHQDKIVSTIFRGTSADRQRIFKLFTEYYENLGYKVFSFDTDSDKFNRSASRNTAAMVSSTRVLTLIDADTFIEKDSLEETIELAGKFNGICRPYIDGYIYQVSEKINSLDDVDSMFVEINANKFNKDNPEIFCLENANGLVFVQRSVFWVGMDERMVEYGNEDSTYCHSVEKIYDEKINYVLSGKPAVTLNHGRFSDTWSSSNLTDFHSYFYGNKDEVIELCKKYGHYGKYGKFTHL